LIWAIIIAIVGSGGFVGLMFYFLRRFIEKKLEGIEDRRDLQIERSQIDDELHQTYWEFLYWLYRSIITGQHNGELDHAFKTFQKAKAKKQEYDRKVIAKAQNKKE